MGSSILGIGQSALSAAQVGLATTAHNIANANSPGYTRQVVIQTSAGAQNFGGGFLGKGTSVEAVRRVYDEYLNIQVTNAQTQKYGYDTYAAQIKQVEDMMADSDAGMAPALQDFFSGVQSLASNPGSVPTRQSMLSSSQALAARFQSMDTRLQDIRNGVEGAIGDTIRTINSYAQQIATLNDAIAKAQGPSGDQAPANDLLDQRDQLISELSKEIKVSYVKQGSTYNVFIGNGQPLVVDTQTYNLTPTVSPTDGTRTEVGYASGGGVVVLDERNFTGGNLGGLLDFRANTLDPAQSQLGRVAVGLAMTFNAQHQLGQDRNGAMGGDFFKVAPPVVNASSRNTGNEQLGVTLADGTALTGSDYQVRFVGGQYDIVRLSDKTHVYTGATLPTTPVDGLSFNSLGGASADGDEFLVRPTIDGAASFSVVINDVNKIAASSPIRTSVGTNNTGNGKISAGSVNAPAPTDPNLQVPVKITFASATTYTVSGDPTTYT
ncbi:flagellar hook-associated protein FlgK, partial [Oxalobacteraceae bacterium OM1]